MRVDELAKGWLLALVEDAPLEDAAAIMAGDVARDGPRICDAVVRAVCDEGDLRRIERGGMLEPLVSRAGELAGADAVEAAAHAVETLRGVVWSALRAELSEDDPGLLADAADRLSLVAEQVRGAVLRRHHDGEESDGQAGRAAPVKIARTNAPADLSAADGSSGASSGEAADERDASGRGAEEGDPLWIDALRDEIVTAGRARAPLSLLLVELEDAERLVAIEPHGEATATFGRFAVVLRSLVRRRDVLAGETGGRAWIIARDTGRDGAEALGTRIATTVPAEESWRGAPLTVSVGLAVLGEDGDSAAALIDAAEQTRFAAEASGIGIVSGVAGDGGGDPPARGPGLAS
jgi:GGDEF domain-containing protein